MPANCLYGTDRGRHKSPPGPPTHLSVYNNDGVSSTDKVGGQLEANQNVVGGEVA